jgi:DNA-binding beta-propeller fold protein YncE
MGVRGRLVGLAVVIGVVFAVLAVSGVFTASAVTGALAPANQFPVTESPSVYPDMGMDPVSVVFSPGGGLLATANEGANDVSVFKVNASSGALTPVTQSATNGLTGMEPDSVAFSPGGGLLATADESANAVSVFKVNPSTGALTPVAGETPVSKPPSGLARSLWRSVRAGVCSPPQARAPRRSQPQARGPT